METITFLAIAVGLAMDAFAVSVASGLKLGCLIKARHIIRLALYFGFFQFLMTMLGWYLGNYMERLIKTYDHWVAMAFLVFIGGKMIADGFRQPSGDDIWCDPTGGLNALILAIATSIDAFAVGLSLGILNTGIWYPSTLIGLVAAAFTVLGMKLGTRIGLLFSHRIELAGGLILISIGLKIIIEHSFNGM